MTNFFTTLIFLFAVNISLAQLPDLYSGFKPPLKSPFSFSGGFGELRSNHFHSGLDFRTGGVTGKPIFAVKDGYVSRANVSPTGYGLALYLNHPDGTTSVYAHLDRFHPKVAERLKEEQYYREQFAIDLKFPKNQIEFKQGEIIAWSGNTGSSGGPHLHFEIRDTDSEDPLNPLFFDLGITDNSAPKITSLFLYPLSDNSHVNRSYSKKRFELVPSASALIVKDNQPIEVFGSIGIGIQAEDFFNGTGMKCGIYSAEVLVDGESQFAFQFNRLSFDLTRNINAHIDYEERIRNSRWVHRLFQLPGNRLKFYHGNDHDGKIIVEQGKTANVEVKVCDAFNNCRVLRFKLVSKPFGKKPEPSAFTQKFRFDQQNVFENEFVRVNLQENSLAEDLLFRYSNKTKTAGYYSPLHQIHQKYTPLLLPYSLALKAEGFTEAQKEKLLVVAVDSETGKRSAIGGDFSNGWVFVKCSQFGQFAIAADSIAPVINPLTIKERKTLTDANKLAFSISDNLSGIKSFRGEIDGKWVLFSYDPKNKLLVHYFDKTKIDFGKNHQLVLTVTDAKNNVKSYKATFYK